MKILINDGLSNQGIDLLKKSGFEIILTRVAQSQLANFINSKHIEILLVRSATTVRKDLIDSCPSIKIIGRAGAGLDNIDVDYAKNKGIKILNTPEASSRSVAELVFAHLFGGVRYLYDSNRNMPLEGDSKFKKLKKSYSEATELQGKTLGIIGFGKIGKEVAKIALGNGMRVFTTASKRNSPTISLDFYNGQKIDLKTTVLSFEEILKQSDYITLHVPAQKKPLIGKDEISKMKNGVGIINTSRGGIIDEKALLDGINTGKISFAGLDVFENEPSPSVSVLMNPSISLTPHIGGSTVEAQDRIGIELASKIISSLKENK